MDINITSSKKIHNALLAVLVVLAVFIFVKIFTDIKAVSALRDSTPGNTITVSGEGDVSAVADISTFSFSVDESGTTVTDAQEKATNKNNQAIAILKKAGVEDKDIQTAGYSVNPKYDYSQSGTVACPAYGCPPNGNPKIVGYEVTQSVTVKVRDTDKAGSLLTQIGAVGVSNISGLSFTFDDPSVLQDQARSKAIDDAKAKAKELAKELGVSLAGVTSFSENGGPTPIYYAMESKAMGIGGGPATPPTPDIEKGENKITSNVTVTYRIR